jgi:RHH-type transcriptional regulator, rel operon repressor / antitoxin RelB
MLSVSLSPETERRLVELAKRTGRCESDYLREFIEENIDDIEDRYLAEKAMEEDGQNLSSEQVRKELGLDR